MVNEFGIALGNTRFLVLKVDVPLWVSFGYITNASLIVDKYKTRKKGEDVDGAEDWELCQFDQI
jgi:hypothetical protein